MSGDDVVERLRLAAKPEEWTSVWGLTVVRCSLMREAADEIERLRGIVEWLAEWACCDFTDDPNFGPVMTFEDYGDREPDKDYPVPAVIADLLRETHAKHGGVPQ